MAISVLIVEDESIVALDLETRLRGLGFRVVGRARSGEEARVLARETKPDVILMDIQIKGPVDGIETAGIIQRDLDIPSIFLTAYSDSASLERAKQSEAYGYLLKPFQERELVIAIELALYKYRAEREVRNNRRLLQTTLHSIDEGVITVDTDDRILFMNNAAEELTGWTSKDAVGVPLDNVFTVEDSPADGVSWNVLTGKEGTRTPIDIRSHDLSADNPKEPHRVVVFRDISRQIRYEQTLVDAKEAAEAATRAKSDFLSRMSHELRTPLNSILGMVQLAIDTAVPLQTMEYLQILRESADSLNNLISDVLDYAKSYDGNMQILQEPFSLPEMVASLVRRYTEKTKNSDICFGVTLEPNLPVQVIGDRDRILRVLDSLLSNAMKFTERGRIVLSVEQVPASTGNGQKPPDSTFRFTVEDSGIGIPEDRIRTVFDDFSQLEDPATRRVGGAGLGLAIVKRLVDAMGGTVSITSREGAGTTISIMIHLVTEDQRTFWQSERRKDPESSSPDSSLRIAVSDEVLQRILEPWVRQAGNEIVNVATYAEAAAKHAQIFVFRGSKLGHEMTVQSLPDDLDSASQPVPVMIRQDGVSAAYPDKHSTHALPSISLTSPLDTSALYKIATGRVTNPGGISGKGQPVGDESIPERKILIVDDDNVNLMVNRKLIEKLGYTVVSANQGRRALDSMEHEVFSAACIDIEMPEMNGWELAHRIRRGEGGEINKGIALLALTGHDSATIQERAKESGFTAILSKPFKLDELSKSLKEALSTGATSEATPDAHTMAAEELMKIKELIEKGEVETASEQIRLFRTRTTTPAYAEILFRMQLALRRNNPDAALRIIRDNQ